MLTFAELSDELAQVSYKPGWRFTLYEHRFEGIWLSIRAEVPDAGNPSRTTVVNIRTAVPPIPDAAYFHHWLRDYRLDRVDSHERREFYRVGGVKLDDPHAPDANE